MPADRPDPAREKAGCSQTLLLLLVFGGVAALIVAVADSDNPDTSALANVVLIAGVLGLIPAAIANKKGHSFSAWWFFGAALFIVALPMALTLKPEAAELQRRRDSDAAGAGLRPCPWCAEMIRPAASVCRYCGRDVRPSGPPSS
jgi:hypothetical protein